MLLAATDITQEVDRAFLLIGGMCLILLIGITLAMVVLAFRFRRSKARITSQVEGNTLLEVTWTIIPTIIIVWMFVVGYRGFALMDQVPENAMVVQVTGKQWAWTFNYPDARVNSTEMVVPVNTPVLVKLTAPIDDVVHSFYLPDFRVKEDVLPGQETSLWFEPKREGTYMILCAEFCGKDHSKMISMLKVVAPDEYQKWLRDQELKRLRPLELEALTNPQHPGFGEEELNIDSQAIFNTFCASCHGETGNGSGLPGLARDLTSSKGWKRGMKVTDIYRTLVDGIAGSRMRPYPNFTPWERVALAHYVRQFSKEPLPQDTTEDSQALVKEYGLDKVQPLTNIIPIERAMELLIEESNKSN